MLGLGYTTGKLADGRGKYMFLGVRKSETCRRHDLKIKESNSTYLDSGRSRHQGRPVTSLVDCLIKLSNEIPIHRNTLHVKNAVVGRTWI